MAYGTGQGNTITLTTFACQIAGDPTEPFYYHIYGQKSTTLFQTINLHKISQR